jgi:hypothetical protein
MRVRRLIPISISVLFGLAGMVVPALAAPITYTVTAIGTGSLGGSSFTNAAVTVTLTGDTAGVTHPFGSTFNNFGPATVNVAGIGTGTFTNSMIVFCSQTGGPGGIGAAGIEDNVLFLDILDTANAAFASYECATAIGPVTGPALFNGGSAFPTSLGDFILTDVGNSTFTAALGPVVAQSIPTLSEWAMVAMGMLLAAGAVWHLGRRSPTAI